MPSASRTSVGSLPLVVCAYAATGLVTSTPTVIAATATVAVGRVQPTRASASDSDESGREPVVRMKKIPIPAASEMGAVLSCRSAERQRSSTGSR